MENKNEWKKVELTPAWNGKDADNHFPLTKGDEVVGIYTGMETGVGANEANVFSFKGEDGKIISVWGGTILDTRLKNIEIGEEVRIEYLGDEKSKKGWTYHNYDVFHRKVEEGEEEEKVTIEQDDQTNEQRSKEKSRE